MLLGLLLFVSSVHPVSPPTLYSCILGRVGPHHQGSGYLCTLPRGFHLQRLHLPRSPMPCRRGRRRWGQSRTSDSPFGLIHQTVSRFQTVEPLHVVCTTV